MKVLQIELRERITSAPEPRSDMMLDMKDVFLSFQSLPSATIVIG